MSRYHEELKKALLLIAAENDQIDEFRFGRCFISSNTNSKSLLRMDRWLTYPLMLSRATAGNFHILDQSHAHLSLALRRSKCVITCHDLMPVRDALQMSPVQTTSSSRSMLGYLVRGLQRADHVIADSLATKEDLVNLAGIPEERVTVVYLGRNELFKPPVSSDQREKDSVALKEALRIPASGKIVFHVGTGSPVKNTPAILHAIKLNEQLLYFVRAGMDVNEDERQLLESLNLADRYRYAGAGLSDDRLALLYRCADVFVFPSFWEGFGWPPIEAMSSATPVVCSNIGSLNEVVQDAALQVEPTDHAGLSSAITKLLTDVNLREDLIQRGLKRASQFSWRETAMQVQDVYKRSFLSNR